MRALFSSRAVLAAVAALCTPATACGSEPATLETPAAALAEAVPAQPMQRPAATLGRFGLCLLSELAERDEAGNVAISPVSVATGLVMAGYGGDGAARAAIANVLADKAVGFDRIAADVSQVTEMARAGVANDTAVTLLDANALWVGVGSDVFPAYIRSLARDFDARASVLDFADPAATAEINDWVSDRTNGEIPTIVEQLDARTALVLTNASYFKATWAQPFDPANTKPLPFTVAASEIDDVPTMVNEQADFGYRDADGWRIAELAFGGGDFRYRILLPHEGDLADRVNEACRSGGEELVSGGTFEARRGRLALPRHELSFGSSLMEPLGELGFAGDRLPATAFAGMAMPPPKLSDVLHKAVVKVTEEGAEAAAATAIVMERSFTVNEFQFVVDRPFVAAIIHASTGQPLFMTLVRKPSAALE